MDFDVESLKEKYGDVPGIEKILEVMSTAIKSGDIVLESEDDFLNFLRLCRSIANKILKGKKIPRAKKVFASGEKLITGKEAAEMIGYEIKDITNMVKERILNGAIKGRGSLVALASVNEYIASHPPKENPGPEGKEIQEGGAPPEGTGDKGTDKESKDSSRGDFVRLGIALGEDPPPEEEKKKPEIIPEKVIPAIPASKGLLARLDGTVIRRDTGELARPASPKKAVGSEPEKPREIVIPCNKDEWCDVRDIAEALNFNPSTIIAWINAFKLGNPRETTKTEDLRDGKHTYVRFEAIKGWLERSMTNVVVKTDS
jgi:hypothetical protein